MTETKKPEAEKYLRTEAEKPVFIIGNPEHRLGFMVVSTDDPLGFKDPAEAVSELGFLRQKAGMHLKLYEAVPVDRPIVGRQAVEAYNLDAWVEDFDFSLVEEHIE